MVKNLNFFVVDDDPDIVDLITEVIATEGHTVASTTSSVAAHRQIAQNRPDCAIIDLMMPEVDGLELCRELREDKKLAGMKIIVISGKSYEFDRRRAFEFGADGFIQKPIEAATFVDRINRVVEDKVDLTFWGVRGTLPVSGERSLRYGGNTSCITMEFPKDQFFIFDAGTGIKELSDSLMSEKRTKLDAKMFISHPHWDHINALPFFAPLYIPGNEFQICGASHGDVTMRELISAQMEGIYFPITIKEFGSRVFFRDLKEEKFVVDDINISTKLLNHPGYCLGYRIDYNGRSICYITDNELYLQGSKFHNPHYVRRLAQFIEGTDFLITDTTYSDAEYATKVGWGHSCVTEVVALADAAKVKTLCLFHHDPDQSDDDIDAKLETARKLLAERDSPVECLAPTEGQTFKI
jgi:phosphoribosyl 1,2-cyclic phosphodiesterase/CheY-like chemotaxis protein